MTRRLAFGLFALALMTSCGLPDEIRNRAESLGDRIVRESESLAGERRKLAAFLDDSDNAFLRPYAERESWDARFDEAAQEIEHARALFGDEVSPLLDADDPDTEAALRDQLKRVGGGLDRAVAKVREPASRAAFLRAVRDEGPSRVAEARESVGAASAGLAALQAETQRAATDYPEKAEDLAGRIAAVRRSVEEAGDQLAVAERELADLASSEADLAVLGDATAAAASGAAAALAADAALRGKASELYRSYSKQLEDMKQEASVEIGRTSWNEAYDFPKETEIRFRQRVSPEDLEALEAWGDRPIATLSSFFGRQSLNVAIDSALWDRLEIAPQGGMPRGDNAAEFWVGESSVRYFHRYVHVEDAEKQTTDWQEVSEESFEEHYDDLGMDVLAKPYGMYEEEALTEAAPPGMAFVGNPRYGKWESDGQGRRHWSWGEGFLFYYLLFGGPRHYYYHNDWNRWNRDYRGRRAWYGPNDGYGTYGRRTRNSSRYAGGAFAGTGGFRRADNSVRGAGPSGRGGGPGGGGK